MVSQNEPFLFIRQLPYRNGKVLIHFLMGSAKGELARTQEGQDFCPQRPLVLPKLPVSCSLSGWKVVIAASP
jgi:hypothetical protein